MDPKTRIDAIKNGTVLDHLNPGSAVEVLKVLGIKGTGVVTVGMHLESSQHGHKDIIKLENKELTQDEINKLTLISPNARISIIKDYQVSKKFNVDLPKDITGIMKCRNPKCITNNEPTRTKFHVIENIPLRLRCHYCERYMKDKDIQLI